MEKVAFIGLGNMGKPMASQLLAAGFPVTVYNRSRAKAEGLTGSVTVAASPAEAAKGAGLVFTMVADDAALEAVTLGKDGVLDALGADAVHVSTSTISVAFAQRLAKLHGDAGRGYIAAPVFGRPDVAAAGKLWVVTAGRQDWVAKARPALEKIGQQVVDVGEAPEAANLLKLAANFTLAAMLEALGESMALVRKGGIDPAKFLEILNGAVYKSPVYENYGRLVVERKFEPAGFQLRNGLKDARLVLAAADALAVPMPGAGVAYGNLLSALAQGMGDQDWSCFSQVIARNAGLK